MKLSLARLLPAITGTSCLALLAACGGGGAGAEGADGNDGGATSQPPPPSEFVVRGELFSFDTGMIANSDIDVWVEDSRVRRLELVDQRTVTVRRARFVRSPGTRVRYFALRRQSRFCPALRRPNQSVAGRRGANRDVAGVGTECDQCAATAVEFGTVGDRHDIHDDRNQASGHRGRRSSGPGRPGNRSCQHAQRPGRRILPVQLAGEYVHRHSQDRVHASRRRPDRRNGAGCPRN